MICILLLSVGITIILCAFAFWYAHITNPCKHIKEVKRDDNKDGVCSYCNQEITKG